MKMCEEILDDKTCEKFIWFQKFVWMMYWEDRNISFLIFTLTE